MKVDFNKEDFIAWKKDPITTAFFSLLHDRKKAIHEDWENGYTLSDPLLNAHYLGNLEAINAVLDMHVDDLVGGDDEENS